MVAAAAAAPVLDDGTASVESFETSMNSSILAGWEPEVVRLESSVVSKKRARQQRLARGASEASAAQRQGGEGAEPSPAQEKRARRDSMMPARQALPLDDDDEGEGVEGGGKDLSEGGGCTVELPNSLGGLLAQEAGLAGEGGEAWLSESAAAAPAPEGAAAGSSETGSPAATVQLPFSLGDLVTQELLDPESMAAPVMAAEAPPQGAGAEGAAQETAALQPPLQGGAAQRPARRFPRPPPPPVAATAPTPPAAVEEEEEEAPAAPPQPPLPPRPAAAAPPPQLALGLSRSPAPLSLAARRAASRSKGGAAAPLEQQQLQQRRVTIGIASFSSRLPQQPPPPPAAPPLVASTATEGGGGESEQPLLLRPVPVTASLPVDATITTARAFGAGGEGTFMMHEDGCDDTASSAAIAGLQSMLGCTMDDATAEALLPAAAALSRPPPRLAPPALSTPTPAEGAVAAESTRRRRAPTPRRAGVADSPAVSAAPAPPAGGTPLRRSDRRRRSSSRASEPAGEDSNAMDVSMASLHASPLRQEQLQREGQGDGEVRGPARASAAAAEASSPASAPPAAAVGWRPYRMGTPATRDPASGFALADASAIDLSGSIVFGRLEAAAPAAAAAAGPGSTTGDSRLLLESPQHAAAAADAGDVTAALPTSLLALAREEAEIRLHNEGEETSASLAAGGVGGTHTLSMALPQTPRQQQDSRMTRGTPIHALLSRVSDLQQRLERGGTERDLSTGEGALGLGEEQRATSWEAEEEDATAVLPAGLGALMAQEGLLSAPGTPATPGTSAAVAAFLQPHTYAPAVTASAMSEVDDVEERALASLGVTPNRALRQADREASAAALLHAAAAAQELEQEMEAETSAVVASGVPAVTAAVPAAAPLPVPVPFGGPQSSSLARGFMAQLAAAAAPPPHAPSEPAPVAPLQQQQQQQPVTVFPLQPPQAPAAATQRPPLSVLSLPVPGPFTFAAAPQQPSAAVLAPLAPTQEALTQPIADPEDEDESMGVGEAAPAPAATPSRERLLRAVARTASRPQRPAPPAAALPPNPPAYASAEFPALPPSFGSKAPTLQLRAPRQHAAAPVHSAAPAALGAHDLGGGAGAAAVTAIATLGDLCRCVGIPLAPPADPPGAACDVDLSSGAAVSSSPAAAALYAAAYLRPAERLQNWVSGALSEGGSSAGTLDALLSAPLRTRDGAQPFIVTAVHASASVLLDQQRPDAAPPTPESLAESQHFLFRVQGLHSGFALSTSAAYLSWRAQALAALSAELQGAISSLQVRAPPHPCRVHCIIVISHAAGRGGAQPGERRAPLRSNRCGSHSCVFDLDRRK